MTATASIEELLREALDRMTRQERRMESLEATVFRTARPPLPVSSSSVPTPVDIPWPRRELPKPVDDRVAVLEARVAEAEERLRHGNRLETVGRLVAGVAHDFNNLLTVIAGNADIIRSGLPTGDHLHETAELIMSTAQLAANVTRQLLAFGRPSSPDPCPVDPNVSVRGVERTLRRLTGERVALVFSPATSIPLVRADPGQFDQVLLNLVVNARDAVVGDGTITIRTAHAAVAAGRPAWPADVPVGDYVAVTVTDTGAGMPAEVAARIFDPFFTTKGERGTGLGLSTVRDIIRAAGGHIEVESSPGWGTSVRVYWPVFPESGPASDATLKLMR